MQHNESEAVFASSNPHIETLHREADNIQRCMEIPASLTDPAALTYRLNELDTFMARLGDMVIRAKAMKDRAKSTFVFQNGDELNKLSATVSNRKIDAFLQDYSILYNRLDTMYGTIEHLTRDLVTQISYIKKQMEQFGG